ncbi:class I SAM-dependent methyltransferase [Streptomyces sp. NPDC088197]|uniref:class I SAM-dependent methyltransferase n=1 Tax=unclassified Streptomyces TaxID=2593676 RepID=UPI00381FFB73
MTSAEDRLPAPTELAQVEGWFFPVDQVLFDWFLTRQVSRTEPGDLLEVGAYLGKSAIFMGSYLREGDTFTVCDLFDAPAEDNANSAEMKKSYPTLTRHSFEANYLSFHDELPEVVQGMSSTVRDRVQPVSCRFAHIDASHLYEHVHADIETSRELLHPHGVVALDDYRSAHCPGVAAAVWQAVTSGGLHAICVTESKMYATWGDPAEIRAELLAYVSGRADLWHEVQTVAGAPLLRVKGDRDRTVSPSQPPSRHAPAAAQAPDQTAGQTAAQTAAQTAEHAESAAARTAGPAGRAESQAPTAASPAAPAPRRSRARRLLVNVLPPIITKALVRIRDSRRAGA